jgi:hypothetical protein
MSSLEAQAHLSEAKKFASAASFDIQRFAPETEAAQALHNLQSAIDAIIEVLDDLTDDE